MFSTVCDIDGTALGQEQLVLRIRKSFHFIYSLSNIPLQKDQLQIDLGVLKSNTLHPCNNIQQAIKTAYQRLRLIKKMFYFLKKSNTLQIIDSPSFGMR